MMEEPRLWGIYNLTWNKWLVNTDAMPLYYPSSGVAQASLDNIQTHDRTRLPGDMEVREFFNLPDKAAAAAG